MKYIVDARFENGKPRLRLLDGMTGAVRLEWALTRVDEMLREGEIPREDFLHPERYGMQLLVKNLFLLGCLESMSSQSDQCRAVNQLHSKRVQSDVSDWHFSLKAEPV